MEAIHTFIYVHKHVRVCIYICICVYEMGRVWQHMGEEHRRRFLLKDMFLFTYLGIQLIYNVVLITAVQQSDSVINIYIFFIYTFLILFPLWFTLGY